MIRATFLLTAMLSSLSMGVAAQATDAPSTMGTAGSEATDTDRPGMEGVPAGGADQALSFGDLDTDTNGVLDQEELEEAGLSGDLVDAMDQNGDGQVEENEYIAFQRQHGN